MRNLIYFRSTSYGSEIYETVILKDATLEQVRNEYLKDKPYCNTIFDRNADGLKSKGYFTLPDGYNTMYVQYSKDFKETPNTKYI